MDALQFAVTKIQPPRPRGTRLARPVLRQRLADAVLQHRLVLLMAPAGGGKTAALAELLAGGLAGVPALAWVSLDEDDDAQRLLACLAAALDPFDLPWRTAPEALVAQLGQPGPADDHAAAALRRVADELGNALAAAEAPRGLLVLDDLHRLGDGGLALVEALARRLPPHWTLLMASRTPPSLPLARWRAAGELAELGQAELAFSTDELQALAADLGQPPAWLPDALASTQGWPAGVQLCLASARSRPGAVVSAAQQRSTVDRHLFDFLATEVLDDLPAALHDFLLRCAVLPELTVPRAVAVSGDAQAAHWLDEVDRRALFATPLDAPEPTWVLHDLFRQVLLQRLAQRLPGELPQLLTRAAHTEPDPVRRIGYLLRAADWPAAERLLDDTAAALFVDGLAAEVQRLTQQFPTDWRQASARLLRLQAVVACLQWRWADMAQLAGAAVQAAQSANDLGELQHARVWLAGACYPLGRTAEMDALLDALRGQPLSPPVRRLQLVNECSAHFRRGQRDQVPQLFAQLVDSLEAGGSLFDWWACTPATTWSTVRGMRPHLARFFAGALRLLGDRPLPMRAELAVNQAFNRLWGGDVAQAIQQAAQVEADLGWLACSADSEVTALLLRLIIDAMHGRAEAVWQGLDVLSRREDEGGPERRRAWRHQMAIYGVRLADVLGDLKALRLWADRLDEQPLLNPPSEGEVGRNPVVRARHAAQLAAAAAPADAPRLWAQAADQMAALLPRLPGMDALAQTIEMQLRAAHALHHAGRHAAALAALQPALLRMAEEGDRGHALMCGPRVLAELAGVDWGDGLAPGHRQVLLQVAAQSAQLHDHAVRGLSEAAVWRSADQAIAAASTAAGAIAGPASDAAPVAAPSSDGRGAASDPRAAGLSEREQEVLACIAAGHSNKLIARQLDISPHTVKRHVANILDKLGLASRGQAAAWSRAPVPPA